MIELVSGLGALLVGAVFFLFRLNRQKRDAERERDAFKKQRDAQSDIVQAKVLSQRYAQYKDEKRHEAKQRGERSDFDGDFHE